MQTLWFRLVAVMITAYVVLGRFRSRRGRSSTSSWPQRPDERSRYSRAIGPFGTAMKCGCSRPAARFTSLSPAVCVEFSGFYLPLMMVLWLLMLRGIGIEFRVHIDSPVWKPLWDVVFGGASACWRSSSGRLGKAIRGSPWRTSFSYVLALCRVVRASIRFARGDLVGASADSERALEAARRAKDAQVVAPALHARATALLAEGRRAEADALAGELLTLGPECVVALGGFDGARHCRLAWLTRELRRVTLSCLLFSPLPRRCRGYSPRAPLFPATSSARQLFSPRSTSGPARRTRDYGRRRRSRALVR